MCIYLYISLPLSMFTHICMVSLSLYDLHMYLHANVYQTPLQIIAVAVDLWNRCHGYATAYGSTEAFGPARHYEKLGYDMARVIQKPTLQRERIGCSRSMR